jgi:hypothetical protein
VLWLTLNRRAKSAVAVPLTKAFTHFLCAVCLGGRPIWMPRAEASARPSLCAGGLTPFEFDGAIVGN